MLAIVHGRAVTVSSETIEDATILISEGKILGVQSGGDIPEGAEIIDASGMVITPGLIDAHTHLGGCEDGIPESMEDINERTDPITPHLRVLDAIYPADPAFEAARRGGVTTVQILPGSANVIGGQGAIVKTIGNTVEEMVIKAPSGMKAALGENPKRVYGEQKHIPSTRMGNAACMRQALTRAKDYMDRKKRAARKDDFLETDLAMEALIPVIEDRLPLRIHSHRADDILTGIRIAEEFGIRYTIEHCTEGHIIKDRLAQKGVMAAVGPTLSSRPKLELRNLTWRTIPELAEAGVHICLITDHPVIPIENLSLCAILSVREGLSEDAALRAVTLNAAEHLGIADQMGSIESGKDADLVIWNGDPFDARTRISRTFIDGREVFCR